MKSISLSSSMVVQVLAFAAVIGAFTARGQAVQINPGTIVSVTVGGAKLNAQVIGYSGTWGAYQVKYCDGFKYKYLHAVGAISTDLFDEKEIGILDPAPACNPVD